MPDHPLLVGIGDRPFLERVHRLEGAGHRRIHTVEIAVLERHPADVERQPDRGHATGEALETLPEFNGSHGGLTWMESSEPPRSTLYHQENSCRSSTPARDGSRLASTPLPLSNLGHVLALGRDVTTMLDRFVSHRLLYIRSARVQLREPIDQITDEMKPVEIVADSHVERRGDRAFLLVASNMVVEVIGSAVVSHGSP